MYINNINLMSYAMDTDIVALEKSNEGYNEDPTLIISTTKKILEFQSNNRIQTVKAGKKKDSYIISKKKYKIPLSIYYGCPCSDNIKCNNDMIIVPSVTFDDHYIEPYFRLYHLEDSNDNILYKGRRPSLQVARISMIRPEIIDGELSDDKLEQLSQIVEIKNFWNYLINDTPWQFWQSDFIPEHWYHWKNEDYDICRNNVPNYRSLKTGRI